MRLAATARFWRIQINTWDLFDLASILTIILLLLYSGSNWYLQAPIHFLCIAGLIHPPLRKNGAFWLMICSFLGASHYHHWYTIDNHKYLLLYWCIAICLSCYSRNRLSVLIKNATYLIFLSFAFAFLWKVLTSNYVDNSFFHLRYLEDSRFRSVAQMVGGLSPEALIFNDQSIRALTSYDSTLQNVTLKSNSNISVLAYATTWWTLLIEGLIALAFIPVWNSVHRYRDYILFFFIASTYAIAWVPGFGWLLAIMGLVQANQSRPYTRLFYVASFFLIVIYSCQWSVVFQRLSDFL